MVSKMKSVIFCSSTTTSEESDGSNQGCALIWNDRLPSQRFSFGLKIRRLGLRTGSTLQTEQENQIQSGSANESKSFPNGSRVFIETCKHSPPQSCHVRSDARVLDKASQHVEQVVQPKVIVVKPKDETNDLKSV